MANESKEIIVSPIIPDDNNNGASQEGAAAPAALSAKGAGRRRFGLGASGVILTLASKPGMAAFEEKSHYCGSVSGWHSVTVMSRAVSNVSCTGLSADIWARDSSSWPKTVAAARFGDIFPAGKGGLYCDSSMFYVVAGKDLVGETNKVNAYSSPSADALRDLRREFVAAHLNYLKSFNARPTTIELQAIWDNFVKNGQRYHVASTGEYLDRYALKKFLMASHG